MPAPLSSTECPAPEQSRDSHSSGQRASYLPSQSNEKERENDTGTVGEEEENGQKNWQNITIKRERVGR